MLQCTVGQGLFDRRVGVLAINCGSFQAFLRHLTVCRCVTIARMLTERLFARSARSRGKPNDSAPTRWHHGPWWSNSYLLTPLISILVFLVVMSLILWSLNRREQQQQEDTLYRNVAWAQQQIRLSMTGAQEQIQALARDIARWPRRPAVVPEFHRRHHAGASRDPLHELVHGAAQAALAEYAAARARLTARQAHRRADGRSRAGRASTKPAPRRRQVYSPLHLRRSRQRLHHVADAGVSRPRFPRLDRGGVLHRRDSEARHPAASCPRSTRFPSPT